MATLLSRQTIGQDELSLVKQLADEAPLRRARICLHRSHADAIQEMLIATCHDSILYPHRQLRKNKTYTMIEGTLTLLFFDEAGNVTREVQMGEPSSGRAFVHRFSASHWHTVHVETPIAVYLETIQGPYQSNDTDWARWMNWASV